MITLYAKGCTPCRNKVLWNAVKRKSLKLGLSLIRKDIQKDPVAAYEANIVYGYAVPFVVINGKPLNVEDFLRD